jgi:jumonji domain-containing protein 2
MTFYPTMEEFRSLTKYIEYMESVGAHKAGIAKIVPPKEWIPRGSGYNPADIEDIEIKPVQQDIVVTQVDGAFKTISDRSRPEISVDSYRRLAISNKYVTPAHNSWEELEELYWKQNLDDKAAAPIYGADVCDTLTDPEVKEWNIKRLDSLLTEVMEEQIPGVNLPYLYFGMWKATFSWHVEDMDLHSINCECTLCRALRFHVPAPQTFTLVPRRRGTAYRPSSAISSSRWETENTEHAN